MFKKIFLDNGIPLVMERSQESRSVCVGIWVKVGSRNEEEKQNGISHFIEHMFFKGTRKRTTRDIAFEIDSLGGELNAFTSRETTTFYVKVLDEHMEKALDLLTDVFLNSVLNREEIEKEKGIIFEELHLIEDTPEDYVHDLFNKHIWGKSRLSQPVLGSKKAIKGFTRDNLTEHIKKHYTIKNIVIACSGNFREKALIQNLNASLGRIRRASAPAMDTCPEFRGKVHVTTKKLSEVHICLGLRGIPLASEDRYHMFLLNTILGAGVSSRLFQEVREKRGLAYSIHSFNISYFDTGAWVVYAGTDRKHADEVIDIMVNEIRGLPGSLCREDLEKSKKQLKGNLVLALESTNSKMINIARQEIYYGRYYSPEDIIRAVEAVTVEEMKAFSNRLIGESPLAITAYGPLSNIKTP